MANVLEQIRSRSAAPARWRTSSAVPLGLALVWCAALAALGGGDALLWAGAHLPQLALTLAGTAAICLVPGLALLGLLWREPLPWPERLALSWGVGAALPPLLLMAFRLLGLPWAGWTTWAYVGLCALALALPILRASGRAQEVASLGTSVRTQRAASLLGLTLAALLARLYTVRDLLVGPNVDSYHHTLVALLLVERQGIFTSWEPYAPLSTFTYHYGFHAIVALFHHLTGAPIATALPQVGQVMSAMTVPLIYALTACLTGSRAAGVWAALLAGFVNLQPAFYAFWGRFPFVTSHLILLAALLCWMRAIEAGRADPRAVALAALVTAGLAHTHYQTTLLAALFLGSYLLALLVRAATWRDALGLIGRAALVGGVALLVALPWLITTLGGNLASNAAYNSERQSGEAFGGVPLPPLTPFFLSGPIIALALAGLLLALRRRAWRPALLAAWALLTLFAALPYLAGLPGTGLIEPNVAPMMLYLTVIPLAGYALGALAPDDGRWAMSDEPSRRQLPPIVYRLSSVAAAIALIGISAWGVVWQRDLVPPYDRLVTPADMRAFAWVRASTPEGARFLVNSQPTYGGQIVVGTDGGWWLPQLAGRQVNVPPMSYGSELASDPGFIERTHALIAELRRQDLADVRPRQVDLTRPEAIEALRLAGIGYVYSGPQPLQGDGTFAAVDRIDTALLRQSPDFRLVYEDGGVEIFELVGE